MTKVRMPELEDRSVRDDLWGQYLTFYKTKFCS